MVGPRSTAATKGYKGQVGVNGSLYIHNDPSHKLTPEWHQLSSEKEYHTALWHRGKGCGASLSPFCRLSHKEIHFHFTLTPLLT